MFSETLRKSRAQMIENCRRIFWTTKWEKDQRKKDLDKILLDNESYMI